MNPFFWLFGGVSAKRLFCKSKFFCREVVFRTNLDLCIHPQHVFWIFPSFVKYLFEIVVLILGWGEFRKLCSKFGDFWVNIHGEISCQSWLLLTLFFNLQCKEANIPVPVLFQNLIYSHFQGSRWAPRAQF